MIRWSLAAVGLCVLMCLPLRALEHDTESKPIPKIIDFNRDVRPVLSSICLSCHGADKASRKAKLRLDTRQGALADLDGSRAIVPGKIAESALYKRITSKDPEEIMPPSKANHQLTAREIAVLKLWIEQGAVYAEHWSFVNPAKTDFPAVQKKEWPRNGIDYFVLARLEKEGLTFSPKADPHALVRRLSIDLTGLPPTPDEVKLFVDDKSANAYEKQVDRLMATPAFGERWARMWMDLARYADSAGYGSDPLRPNLYPFRDWTIEAFNKNLPYDQFTMEQIAGDMLPNATQNQILASAFHRNTMTNTEGGTDDEEFRTAAVKDRANTTAQVWMGLTMGCAQCHTHKFDPITQKEYYQFYAFFNQTEDSDRGDELPTMPLPTPSQKERSDKGKAQIAEVEKQLNNPPPAFFTELAEWEKSAAKPVTWVALDPLEATASGGTTLTKQADLSVLASGANPETDIYTIKTKTDLKNVTAIRLEALPDESLPGKGPGRAGGNLVLTDFRLTVLPAKQSTLSGRYVRVENTGKQKYLHLAEVQIFSGGQNVAPKGKAKQSSVDYDGPPELAIDGNTNGDYNAKSTMHTKTEDSPWWEVDLNAPMPLERITVWNRTDGDTHKRLENFKVEVLDAERKTVWTSTNKESPNPSVNLELNGARQVVLQHASADFGQDNFSVDKAIDGDVKNKSGWAIAPQIGAAHSAVFETSAPLNTDGAALQFTLTQAFGKSHTLGRFRISVTEQKAPVRMLPQKISAVLAIAADQRSAEQKRELNDYFRPQSTALAKTREELAKLNKALAEIKPPNVPVMRELRDNKRRTTKILMKGNFLMPGDAVEPGLLEAFHPMPAGAPLNRLGLAQWLVDKNNPLTARVAVNRFWSQIFGRGLVESEEDFGTQGTQPTHPELLDWMAMEFMTPSATDAAVKGMPGAQWDMKAFLKMLVTSATYQQSAKVTPQLLEKDPLNRLLSRSPRRRLDAEQIRDQALALSGLLSPKIGGPSVYPPQPDGLWRAAFNGERTWATSTGEDRYRRGLYTFWRRTVPYPSMATFDAPSREICNIRRIATNTPLQAFVTLNDPVYVECAQALGRRLVREGGATVEERVKFGLQLVLARPAEPEQVKALVGLYESELAAYKANADAAKKMATQPIGALPAGMDPAEMAAWTIVSNVLLNLDAVLMKG